MIRNFSILAFLLIIVCIKAQTVSKNQHLDSLTVYKTSDKTGKLFLNYHNCTFEYRYNKSFDDYAIASYSKGNFSIKNDTVEFQSEMPSEILGNNKWGINEEFLELSPTNETIEDGFVKIYFDNIAEPQKYKAYELKDGNVRQLVIKECKKDNFGSLTVNDRKIRLFQYLIIERPKNNQLLINSYTETSYYFNFDKIPYNSFHFFTRAYWNYVDFNGLKYCISDSIIKLCEDKISRNGNTIKSYPFLKEN